MFRLQFVLLFLLVPSDANAKSELEQSVIELLLDMKHLACPTTIMVIDESYSQTEGLQQFINNYSGSVMIVETNGFVDVKKGAVVRVLKEPVCYDLIVFNDKSHELKKIIDGIKGNYYVQETVIVSKCPSSDAKELLLRMTREDIIFLTNRVKYPEIISWNVNNAIDIFQKTKNITFNKNLKTDSMMGRKLIVTTIPYPPYTIISTNSHGSLSFGGSELLMLDLLSNSLNFTYQYRPSPADEMWGEILNNKTLLTGMLGLLSRKEADIAIGNLYIDTERLSFISYTYPYTVVYECFLMPSPEPYAKWKALYFPLSPAVWAATIITSIVAVLFLYTVAKISSSFTICDEAFQSPGRCAMFIFANILQSTGEPADIRGPTNRMFLIWWFVLATIVPTVYRGGLISFMTVPSKPSPIDTLQELLDSPIQKTSFGDFFKNGLLNSPDLLQKKLAKQLVVNYNLSLSFEQLLTAPLVVQSSKDNLEYMKAKLYPPDHNGESVHLVKECLHPEAVSFGTQKDSALKPYLDKGLQHATEAGFVDHFKNSVYRKKTYTNKKQNDGKLVRFSLDMLQGAFILFGTYFLYILQSNPAN